MCLKLIFEKVLTFLVVPLVRPVVPVVVVPFVRPVVPVVVGTSVGPTMFFVLVTTCYTRRNLVSCIRHQVESVCH
jgi:hypothetical protein